MNGLRDAFNANGRHMGRVYADGIISNTYARQVGRVLPGGRVISARNRVVALASYEHVYGQEDHWLGVVNSDGKVCDAIGNSVGKIDLFDEVVFESSKLAENLINSFAIDHFFEVDDLYGAPEILASGAAALLLLRPWPGTNCRVFSKGAGVLDLYGDPAGFVAIGGEVADRHGNRVGFVSPNGKATARCVETSEFYLTTSEVCPEVDDCDKCEFWMCGDFEVGSVTDEGELVGRFRDFAGSVSFEGEIRDRDGNYAGDIPNLPRRIAGGAALLLLLSP